MCGIAGYVGEFGADLLERMIALIAHRGPDDAGAWTDTAAGAGLAHRRLAIIDLRPEAHQPMSNEDDTLWVTFNGEIYNFPDLHADPLLAGATVSTDFLQYTQIATRISRSFWSLRFLANDAQRGRS